ncbi:MAG TPA: methyl-accepting chemotaxis protein, partial [Arenimonas sp.]|nr:methyl-accepting chemotaxis protein [Arenimonas sp.]
MRNVSISSKVMAAAAAIATIAFALTAALIYWQSSRLLEAEAGKLLEQAARNEAAQLAKPLDQAIASTRALALAMEGLVEARQTQRATLDAMMSRAIAANPEWVGLSNMWEPDAFDGRDAEFVGTEHHDHSGRIISYWTPGDDGGANFELLAGYDDDTQNSWYTEPREKRQQVVMEPYTYPVDGVDVLMTTLSTPILRNGQFLGMVGIDIGLDRLQLATGAISVMDGSYARLISHAGTVLADAHADRVGKPVEPAQWTAMQEAFAANAAWHGETVDPGNGAALLEVAVPITIGSASERFVLAIAAPQSAVMASARSLGGQIAIIGLLGAALISAVLFLYLRRLVLRPLAQAVAAADDMAAGNIERALPRHGDDEMGRLIKAFGAVRERLSSIAAAQVELREAHDAGRTDQRIDSGDYQGIYAAMADGVNALARSHIEVNERIVAVISRYAEGDFGIEMDRLPGDRARISAAMDAVRDNLVAIKDEILRLGEAAAHGDFSQRGDAARFDHTFRQMVEGLNRLMQTAEHGLNDVARVLTALSKGDLTQRIEADYEGLFGQLKDTANHTVSSLTDLVGRIQNSTGAINTASREIAAGNADLSARTEEQAASLEETASSMEELTSTVKQNAENARQANQLAVGASEVAVKGGQVVSEVVTTMDSINASSQKIVDIIAVIDGIAFQTNILALNAAVEAARAGEQGRGFAVVASEVRALAQRSASAAKEIKALIDDSVGRIADGAQLVDQAGTTMSEIVTSVKRVTDIMAEITAASLEQSSGIEQVNTTISQMDEVTQQNAALVEEATAAARSLEEQAGQLAEAVSAFRLSGAEAPATQPISDAGKAAAPRARSPAPTLAMAAPAPATAPARSERRAKSTTGAD